MYGLNELIGGSFNKSVLAKYLKITTQADCSGLLSSTRFQLA